MDLISIGIAKQMDDRRDILRYPDGPLAPARPLLATVTGFEDQLPTDLLNITDGNKDTCATEAIKVQSGAGTHGSFYFDLGSVKHVLATLRVDMWVTEGTGAIQSFLEGNDIDPTVSGNWRTAGNTLTSTSNGASPTIKETENTSSIVARYVRVRFGSTAAQKGHVKPYTLKLTDLGMG